MPEQPCKESWGLSNHLPYDLSTISSYGRSKIRKTHIKWQNTRYNHFESILFG